MPTCQLDPDLWHRICGHLYRSPPPAQTDCYWEDLHQHDLATVMRVSSVLNAAAAPHLYLTPIVRDLHSFFSGIFEPSPDDTDYLPPSLTFRTISIFPHEAQPSQKAIREAPKAQALKDQKRLHKLELLGLVQSLHFINAPFIQTQPYRDVLASNRWASVGESRQDEALLRDGVRWGQAQCDKLARLFDEVNALLRKRNDKPIFKKLERFSLCAWNSGDRWKEMEDALFDSKRTKELFSHWSAVMRGLSLFVARAGPRHVCVRTDQGPLSLEPAEHHNQRWTFRRGLPIVNLHTDLSTRYLPLYRDVSTKILMDKHDHHVYVYVSRNALPGDLTFPSCLRIYMHADIHADSTSRLQIFGLVPPVEGKIEAAIQRDAWESGYPMLTDMRGFEEEAIHIWNDRWEQWIEDDVKLRSWKGKMSVKGYRETPICEACGAVRR